MSRSGVRFPEVAPPLLSGFARSGAAEQDADPSPVVAARAALVHELGGRTRRKNAYANGYPCLMQPPEVLSFREFRTGLAATLKRVQEPGSGPVFVGAHRKPEAVVMSVSHYRALLAAAERREAVVEALASVRAEGLEPSPEGLEMLEAIAEGRMSTGEARERTLARYRR